MKYISILVAIILMSVPTVHKAMEIRKVAIVKSFFSHPEIIQNIKKGMDDIENKKLDYPDYSGRKGLIWSDIKVTTSTPSKIIEEYNSKKVTEVSEKLQERNPQSIASYPELEKIVCNHFFPKTFETIKQWTTLPQEVYVQLFLQRCNTSEPMSWHQDPGEDYTAQAHYSCVLTLSDQNDPELGWHGGEFKLKPGLPEEPCDEAQIEMIIPQYNQAIIFSNQDHSHAVTEIKKKTEKSTRDLLIALINLKELTMVKSNNNNL